MADNNVELLKQAIIGIHKKTDKEKVENSINVKPAKVIGIDEDTYKVFVYFIDDVNQQMYTFYNKSGEVLSEGDNVRIYYTTNPAKGWIGARCGEPDIRIWGGEGVGRKSEWDDTSEYFNCYEGSGRNIAGDKDKTWAMYATARGYKTKATGSCSTSEGEETIASNSWSHAEGYHTTASGAEAHAEGNYTQATAMAAHAEGYYAKATFECSHAEGRSTTASGSSSHAEGCGSTASGTNGSHAEGLYTKASGANSHAEGSYTKAEDYGSHAEGVNSVAHGYASHAEGNYTKALGEDSHTEGRGTEVPEYNPVNDSKTTGAHAEGNYTKANAYSAHAEGSYTVAGGNNSHAEGTYCEANNANSHAGGSYSKANVDMGFVHGNYIIVQDETYVEVDGWKYKMPKSALGSFNDYSNTDLIFMIGNGTSENNRQNAFAVDKEGYIYCAGIKESGGSSSSLFVPYTTADADAAFDEIML
ncbi:MAG: hypothetical protein J6A19_14630 [Oscillospiraceae bacterium]|nr:hypothetical protein [Oscillospiraceae bacterium]